MIACPKQLFVFLKNSFDLSLETPLCLYRVTDKVLVDKKKKKKEIKCKILLLGSLSIDLDCDPALLAYVFNYLIYSLTKLFVMLDICIGRGLCLSENSSKVSVTIYLFRLPVPFR